MHSKNLFVNDGSDWQAVETIRECLPELDIVPPLAYFGPELEHDPITQEARLTFVVKSINTVDTRTFVVSSQDKEVLGVFDLVGQKQADRFQRLFSSVDIIAQKEIICFGRETAVFK